jgi:O-succinylbenzoic acid--CoA ligase
VQQAVSDSIDLDAVQAILFTSGTTGRPKGAQLTFGNHWHSALGSAWRIGVLPNDRWLVCLPLYHAGGLAIVWRSCIYGTAMVLEQGFSVERVQAAFESEAVSLVSLVPTQLYRLMDAGTRWPDSLRLVLLGGAAATPELMARATEIGVPVATTYGLTETASQTATLLPEDARRKPSSVGKALTGTTIIIADEDGRPLPTGAVGEVVVRGPNVMRGYYGMPESRTLRDGALYTGDLGYLDADGDLWIVQRRSDLIVSGGENVYPAEVEAVLRQHPAVAEVCVVGVVDAEWGQRVAAAIVLKAGTSANEDDIIAFCRERLAGYKRPRSIEFVEALPQTASGKVVRPEVARLCARGGNRGA